MPRLTVDGCALSYAEAGPSGAPVVVLVHGTLGDQRYWGPQMHPFGERYRVLAPSMRHCWPDRWAEGGDFTIDRHVSDLAGLVRALGVGPVRLVGHSRGGHIAFRVAERHPGLVHALVLAEPGGELDESLGGAPPAPGRLGQQAGTYAEAAAMVAAGDIEGALRRVAELTGGPGAWERRGEAQKRTERDNVRTLLGQADERRSPFSRSAAGAIRAPTLLLGGAETQPRFTTVLDALERAIPGVERATIPGAGHFLNRDNPAAFNAAVLSFLDRH